MRGESTRTSHKARVDRFNIDFDGSQLTITTDVGGVGDFVRGTYRHMLVEETPFPIGRIDVARKSDGFLLESTESLELIGESCDPMLPYLKEEVIRRFMQARQELLWFHAGTVERNGNALLIAGVSGQGKSTLTTMLGQRGWRLMSDDVAPIRMDTDDVLSFCQSPLRRLDPGADVPQDEVGSIDREHVELDIAALRREPARLRAVVFPQFERNSVIDLARLSQGEGALELLRHARNIVDHKAAAIERVATLARTVPMYRLCYGASIQGVEAIADLI